MKTTPTPGFRYQIQGGDDFFGVIEKAYDVPAGPNDQDLAVQVNNFAWNHRFWGPAPAIEQPLWQQRISFNPSFGTPAEQAAAGDGDGSARGQGHHFAAFYLPRKDELSFFG